MVGKSWSQHRVRMGRLAIACALSMCASPSQAQQKAAPAPAAAPPPVSVSGSAGGVFRCVDAEGKVEYRNVGDTKGCKRVETDSVTTVPFPKPAPARTDAKAPNRIEAGSQRGRDGDRRRILEEELASEQKRLTDLKSEFNSGEPERRGDERNYQRYVDRVERLKADISRSEANVESLKRELGAARN